MSYSALFCAYLGRNDTIPCCKGRSCWPALPRTVRGQGDPRSRLAGLRSCLKRLRKLPISCNDRPATAETSFVWQPGDFRSLCGRLFKQPFKQLVGHGSVLHLSREDCALVISGQGTRAKRWRCSNSWLMLLELVGRDRLSRGRFVQTGGER